MLWDFLMGTDVGHCLQSQPVKMSLDENWMERKEGIKCRHIQDSCQLDLWILYVGNYSFFLKDLTIKSWIWNYLLLCKQWGRERTQLQGISTILTEFTTKKSGQRTHHMSNFNTDYMAQCKMTWNSVDRIFAVVFLTLKEWELFNPLASHGSKILYHVRATKSYLAQVMLYKFPVSMLLHVLV